MSTELGSLYSRVLVVRSFSSSSSKHRIECNSMQNWKTEKHSYISSRSSFFVCYIGSKVSVVWYVFFIFIFSLSLLGFALAVAGSSGCGTSVRARAKKTFCHHYIAWHHLASVKSCLVWSCWGHKYISSLSLFLKKGPESNNEAARPHSSSWRSIIRIRTLRTSVWRLCWRRRRLLAAMWLLDYIDVGCVQGTIRVRLQHYQ